MVIMRLRTIHLPKEYYSIASKKLIWMPGFNILQLLLYDLLKATGLELLYFQARQVSIYILPLTIIACSTKS